MEKKRRKFTQCPNCGYTFEEVNNFCPNCGQENHDLNVPVKHLIAEFFEGTIHFDTKAWHTLKYLITRPGLLTEKFNMGQRASYVPPFRLYVFVSLIFFTVLALRSHSSVTVATEEEAQKKLEEVDPTIAAGIRTADSLRSVSEIRSADSLATAAATQLLPGNEQEGFRKELMAKFAKFTKDEEHSKQKLLKNVSFMMFVLMPFFGLILYLFYRKQRRNYVEHLMFSIHFHTFFFIAVILGLAVEYFYRKFDVDEWTFWVALIYLFFALHRVYKQSYLRTFFMLIPISFVYLISVAVLMLATVGISIMMS
ncbi:DUF3667 domain-containing protein [Pontibacter mangrovi]|uniref:DUF3667 domain-containing protein n=1 Tax=Pontibacter mangrovi TaxID=2589816 RepID=A0A501W798_9BACT|nr:DUF3667 domain-containing protein [Pontibacter mangrovi]TPE45459.1 DUF3667 domain-containing protein [Pontibacter mangrovi]